MAQQRWDEGHSCKYCSDGGTFTMEMGGETYTSFCGCEAGDEAVEVSFFKEGGWTA
jgi:hypothetical protein